MKYIDMHCDTLTRLYDLGAENTGESLKKQRPSGFGEDEAGGSAYSVLCDFTNLKTPAGSLQIQYGCL